jgi:hypothetical protein
MTDDYAVAGEDGAYVPCPDLAASDDPAAPDNIAVTGQGEGYVGPGQSARAEDGIDDTAAVTGQGAGFVPDPCVYTCAGCVTKHEYDRDANSPFIGTSWRQTVFQGFQRFADVPNSGTGPTGTIFNETSDGPFFTRHGFAEAGSLYAVLKVGLGAPAFPGEPYKLFDEQDRSYVSFLIPAGAWETLHFIGDIYLDTSWSGDGQAESRVILPATPFELVMVNYGTDDLITLNDGGAAALDLDAYPQQVIASGVHPGGYGVPYTIDTLFSFDPTGRTYVAFFFRNLATQTVAWPADSSAAMLIDRYPGYAPKQIQVGPTGGHQILVSTYTLQFCDCPL